MTRREFLQSTGALIALSCAPLASPAWAAEDVVQLNWAQLMPPAPPKPKSFLAGRTGPVDLGKLQDDGTPAPPPQQEGRWLSGPAKPSSSTPAPVVTALDGKRVNIGGYIVPLDFDATQVKEFLLVPFVGACIHVPPPPANQIIYVKSAKGFDIKGTFDPVYVTGKLTTTVAFTGLAEAGYSLEAEQIVARKE